MLDKHVHTQGVGQESISFDLIAGPATRDGLPRQAAIMKPKVLLSVQIQSKKAKMAVKVTELAIYKHGPKDLNFGQLDKQL